MSAADVIDRILTPLGVGFGAFLGIRHARGGETSSPYMAIAAGLAVALILGIIKFNH